MKYVNNFLDLFRPTVSSILSDLEDKLKRLEDVVKYNNIRATQKLNKIDALNIEIKDHTNESTRATRVYEKISEIIK